MRADATGRSGRLPRFSGPSPGEGW